MIKRIWIFALLLISIAAIPMPAQQDPHHEQRDRDTDGSTWNDMQQVMEKMHAGMRSIEPSGNDDADFVRLMLPHHQAAIDMAKVELTHGRDPQMRRLAQEIITDQQSEIELLQLWLKQRTSASHK
jgi:uncharacterized protein (DUF305 family)